MSRSNAGAIIVVPRTTNDRASLSKVCQVCGAQSADYSAVGGGKADTDVMLNISLSNGPGSGAWISNVCEGCADLLVRKIEAELTYISKAREQQTRGVYTEKVMLASIEAHAVHIVTRARSEQLAASEAERQERIERSKEEFRTAKLAEGYVEMPQQYTPDARD